MAKRDRPRMLAVLTLVVGVVFCSILDLQAAINRFLAETNDDPKPFVWAAHPDRVIAAVQRGRQALEPVR